MPATSACLFYRGIHVPYFLLKKQELHVGSRKASPNLVHATESCRHICVQNHRLSLGYENPAISRGSIVAPEMSSARHDPPITADLRFY